MIKENIVSLRILDNVEKELFFKVHIFVNFVKTKGKQSFSCDSENLVIVFEGPWDNCVCSALLMFDLY